MGPTGGFLMGFGVGTALVALLSSRWKEPEGKLAATMREASFAVILLLCSYACGWVQFMTVTGMEPLAAFAVSIAPFIVLDVVKMSVGVSLAHMLKVAVPALRRKKICLKAQAKVGACMGLATVRYKILDYVRNRADWRVFFWPAL
ncbi:MAG: biotin transporter BioY [Eggerthellaceae bacterium]